MVSMNEVFLEPCPFCGSRNIRISCEDPFDGYQGPGTNYHKIQCRDCAGNITRKTIAEVLAARNRRAPAPVYLDAGALAPGIPEKELEGIRAFEDHLKRRGLL